MELLNNLALGFGVAFTWINLLYAFFGCVLGTLIGVLPGIGPVATIAMLLPSIYALDATPALIMLAGIYYGAQYGGSTTAILMTVFCIGLFRYLLNQPMPILIIPGTSIQI